eukprot:9468254-Pyramimonas_sp.AAC.1
MLPAELKHGFSSQEMQLAKTLLLLRARQRFHSLEVFEGFGGPTDGDQQDFVTFSEDYTVFGDPEAFADLDVCCGILGGISEELGATSIKAKNESYKDWKARLPEGVHKGAGRAHKWTRLPKKWAPTSTLSELGAALSDPKSVLSSEAAKRSKLWWRSSGDKKEASQEYIQPLGVLEPSAHA